MKKVGIMTMHRIANYGSFLQAYALKQLIETLDCQVEFVDYHIEAPVVKKNADNEIKFVRKVQKGLEVFSCQAPFSHKINFIRHKQDFTKKYLPILGVTSKMNYNSKVDCLVIGSDEVFNCIQKNTNVGYSPELFGKNNNAERLISYAASFGNTTLDKLAEYNKVNEISNLLKKFDGISVRDENSSQIIERLIGKKPLLNLDPVLVYDYSHYWNKVPKIASSEKYLILYAYSGRISDEEASWISHHAKKKNLKIYVIGGIQKYADCFINCSPFEVLSYFKNAEEVITDTFHGSIFAIITHRPFVTLVRKSIHNSYGNEEKLMNLLQQLGLKEHAIFHINQADDILGKKVDFGKIDIYLKNERENTMRYLDLQLR